MITLAITGPTAMATAVRSYTGFTAPHGVWGQSVQGPCWWIPCHTDSIQGDCNAFWREMLHWSWCNAVLCFRSVWQLGTLPRSRSTPCWRGLPCRWVSCLFRSSTTWTVHMPAWLGPENKLLSLGMVSLPCLQCVFSGAPVVVRESKMKRKIPQQCWQRSWDTAEASFEVSMGPTRQLAAVALVDVVKGRGRWSAARGPGNGLPSRQWHGSQCSVAVLTLSSVQCENSSYSWMIPINKSNTCFRWNSTPT